MTEYKWIRIEEVGESKSGKTKIYDVIEKGYGTSLGSIKCRPNWRKYAFYPINDSWYEEECLRNIAEFLESLKHE